MKKAKIMLAILAVVAAVGGGLAFKAKTYSQSYCIGTASGTNTTCSTFSGGLKTVPLTSTTVPLVLYTITSGSSCPATLTCVATKTARLITE